MEGAQLLGFLEKESGRPRKKSKKALLKSEKMKTFFVSVAKESDMTTFQVLFQRDPLKTRRRAPKKYTLLASGRCGRLPVFARPPHLLLRTKIQAVHLKPNFFLGFLSKASTGGCKQLISLQTFSSSFFFTCEFGNQGLMGFACINALLCAQQVRRCRPPAT